MKKNPVMFAIAMVFLFFIAAMFLYNNLYQIYSKTSFRPIVSSKPQPSKTSIISETSSKLNSHQTTAAPKKISKFKYSGPPAFSLTLPDNFRQGTPKIKEGQIFTGKTASGVNVTISVYNIPNEISMEDNGPKIYRPRLAGVKNLPIDDIKIISNEKFEVEEGTIAWKCVMKWASKGSTIVTTYLLTADREGKRITIAAHPWADPAEVLKILNSLTFK